LWDGDGVRLTGGEEWDARMWVSSEDWNLIAQLDAIKAMVPIVLGKDGGTDIRVGDDLGGERAPGVIGGEEKRLEYALGKAMTERKKKESQGDIVECYPQILQPM
jgi:hypothetical protein